MDDTLTYREVKIARQYLAPNTRAEVDWYLSRELPLHPQLRKLVLDQLKKHLSQKEQR